VANSLYDKGREGFLAGTISWSSDTIRVFLIDSASYTPNLATDQYLSIVSEAARKGNNGSGSRTDAVILTSKTVLNGVADAADIIISAVTAGPALEYILIFKDSGDDSTSPLIALIDTATGLPITPTGADIKIEWPDTSNKIFKL